MRSNKVTMSDIAKAAGVSQPTVSLILNRKYDSFQPETIENVINTAARLGYELKSASKPVQNKTVLVIGTQMTNPYYANMLQGIDRAAISQGINILTANTYHNPDLETGLIETAIQKKFLGIIFMCPPDNVKAYEQANERIPIVTICDRSSIVSGDIVELNNYEAGSLAAKHLLQLGHRNIAIISHYSSSRTTNRAARMAGILNEFKNADAESGILILNTPSVWNNMLDQKDFHYQIGFSLAQDPRIEEQKITGFICINDLVAYGVMAYLSQKGYRFPQDYSVVGSDNLLFSSMPQISLTTIELNSDVIGHSALTTLLNRNHLISAGQPLTSTTRFHVHCHASLIARTSTGPVRRSD